MDVRVATFPEVMDESKRKALNGAEKVYAPPSGSRALLWVNKATVALLPPTGDTCTVPDSPEEKREHVESICATWEAGVGW